MGTMLQDLRFGLRMLAKNPGFTAVAVVTLALGIGANTAIFSVIDAMWLRPLPVKEPRQLIQLATVGPVMTSSSFSYPAFKRFRNENRSEEHTSELQSHSDLVCRLLREKKNRQNIAGGIRCATRAGSNPWSWRFR